jgi:hypothetical protein
VSSAITATQALLQLRGDGSEVRIRPELGGLGARRQEGERPLPGWPMSQVGHQRYSDSEQCPRYPSQQTSPLECDMVRKEP